MMATIDGIPVDMTAPLSMWVWVKNITKEKRADYRGFIINVMQFRFSERNATSVHLPYFDPCNPNTKQAGLIEAHLLVRVNGKHHRFKRRRVRSSTLTPRDSELWSRTGIELSPRFSPKRCI